ncbi:MAG: transglutaminase domain-containing protein [Ferruginibacter sp.]
MLIFSFVTYTATSQQPFSSLNFSQVDTFVLSVKFENDYIKLAHDLTDRFPEDVYKVRAIFKWICNNIAYDYRFINSGKELNVPDCADQFDCIEIMRSWENDYIKKILRTRKATADGYSKLFQKLCEIVYIQGEVLPGYLRSKPYQIGNKMSVNHSWNAVLIDADWCFVDVTLASGYCIENEETDKLVRFVKDFQHYYWLTPFEKLARTHYPKNGFWGDLYHLPLSRFYNNPHYYSIDILDNISDECPDTGFITIKKDDTIHFSFTYKKDIRFIQVNSNNYRNPSLWTTVAVSKRKTKVVRDDWAEKKQIYLPFNKTGQQYSFDYVVKDMSLYYVEIAFDYKKAMRYKINVVK